ncbi:MAG TPA: primosomal protein N' [Candidatus Portnoybacteria bacterium]|nr:primosomal protein N' [Candidatus Portnoybacteria bacterium]
MIKSQEIYLLEVIPLTRSARVLKDPLLYYSLKNNLQEGLMILIPLRKKNIPGVVWRVFPPQKMFLRQIGFQIQPIGQILISQPVFTSAQLKLAEYLGNYYWISPGIFLQMMWPFKNILRSKKINRQDKVLIDSPIDSRIDQKLILFPQIGHLENFVKQNQGKLKDAVIFHSQLRVKKNKEIWSQIKSGQVKTIIGTRQAIFLPFVNLREIIINEAENHHYSSWDLSPHYSAKIVAGYLKKIFNSKLKFISATPTIQDYYLSQKKKIELEIDNSLSKLKKESCQTEIIDLQKELARGNFSILSQKLEEELNGIVKKNQSALLFLGRRGFSKALVCQDCGYVFTCPNCGTSLTRHIEKSPNGEIIEKLICHHCGWEQPKPKNCPTCHSYRFKNVGSGVQKIEYILGRILPGQKVARLDSDINKNEIIQIINEFQENKIRFLIATQKFLSYANLILSQAKLVAIISADTFLSIPDFQAAEELFIFIQKIKQKLNSSQKFLIQTYSPQNKIIQWAINDQFEKFYQNEIQSRRQLNYPPFSYLAYLEFTHKNKLEAYQKASDEKLRLEKAIRQWQLSSIEILGPIAGLPPMKKGLFVWRLLVKAKNLSDRNKILTITKGRVEI